MTDSITRTGEDLLGLFAAQVTARGDTIAVRHADTALSFGELDDWSNHIASRLTEHGIGQGDLVGLSVDHSPAVVAAMLALLKIRAAFVALEPWTPLRRRRQILADSGASALLVGSAHDRYPESTVPRIRIGRPASGSAPRPVEAALDDLFHVVHTSGTTGTPKGVAIPVGAVLNRLAWMWRDHPFPADAVMLAHKSYGLVAAPWELLGGLLQGVPTVLVDQQDLLDSEILVPMLATHGVTHLFLTPHLIELLLDSAGRHPAVRPPLRLVTSSADILRPDLARRFLKAFPDTKLINLYGLTECSSNVAAYDLADLPADATRVSVGRPVAGARITVLDRAGRPTPTSTTGEIVVAGPMVALGYWRAGDAGRFEVGPDGERRFRTGDIGHWRRDGSLELTGRQDNQVKVRGFRVELEDVEAVLAGAPGVTDVGVAMVDDELAAAVVGVEDVSTVRAFARDLLPDHMVPASIVALPALPVAANGKLDRHRLVELLSTQDEEPTPPADFPPGLPRQIAEVWASVVGTAPRSADENFFDAGGHSLLAVRLVTLLRDELAPELSLRAFYDDPTVAGLAARLT